MIEKAYAKINLSLDIKDKREDNYHDLETIMLPIELHDTIDISYNRDSEDDFVVCDNFCVKVSKYNLVHKMLDEARKELKFKEHFNINIHKNIFIQAGLGGGSADAGAALRAIIKMLNLKVSNEQLMNIGIKIGSDVPWAIFNKPTLLKRKGDELEFFEHKSPFYVILVKPKEGLSTQVVFNKFDENPEAYRGTIEKVKEAYLKDDLDELDKITFNVLQNPAISFLPEIEKVIDYLRIDGFKSVLMTGSGSCVFGLTKDKKLLKYAEEKYESLGYDVCATKFLD